MLHLVIGNDLSCGMGVLARPNINSGQDAKHHKRLCGLVAGKMLTPQEVVRINSMQDADTTRSCTD
ncbi:hypothetical protein [Scytonema sp. NUACC26]|uniref:hypothetical protein n=1 Tax=Scytonema sp. NUACC26 TaxID=3140176 RepID=UPI0038B282EF